VTNGRLNRPATDDAWMRDAACKGQTDLFALPIPRAGQPTKRWFAQAAQAKQICATCPVIDPCRNWALDHQGGGTDPAFSMVAGGMTPPERFAIWRRRHTKSGAA
jgi:WhiB family redox-sensing transcriptional regulator